MSIHRVLSLLLILIMVAVLGGPSTLPNDSLYPPAIHAQAQAAWTIMIYVAADNDLESFALADLNELEFVGSSDEVNILVQIDRSDLYDVSDGNWTEARRYYITQNRRVNELGSELIASLGEINTGDPVHLIDFATWAITTYPAKHYALVLWDHGSSWSGIASDDSANNDDPAGAELRLPEIAAALDTIITQTGIETFDLIGFDACLMGAFEVYRAIAPYANYSVASAELVPGQGWDYYTVFDTLTQNPTMTAEQLGSVIVNSFYTYYTEKSDKYNIFNLALVDLSAVDGIIDSMLAINDIITADPATAMPAIAKARSKTNLFGAFDDPQFVDYWAAIDLFQFMKLLADNTENVALAAAATKVYNARDALVLDYKSNNPHPDEGGISIFFPFNQKQYFQGERAARYADDVVPIFTFWEIFLTSFYASANAHANQFEMQGIIARTVTSEDGIILDLGLGSNTIAQAAFYVIYHLSPGRSIIVDYARLNAVGGTTQTQWNGNIPWLTNQTHAKRIPVLVVRSRRDPNIGIVNGKIYPKDGKPVRAQIVFDLTTGEAQSEWGFRETTDLIMPFEFDFQEDDLFQPYWLSLGPGGIIVPSAASVQFQFSTWPFLLEWEKARAGAYEIVVQADGIAGDSDTDTNTVLVDGDTGTITDLDPDEVDYDGDGILNEDDNCPYVANPDQADADGDGNGDVCDLFNNFDYDDDGILNEDDNCPLLPNLDQMDSDGDGIGDICDTYGIVDTDGDGIEDDTDNCRTVPNLDQIDIDIDSIGDACDDLIDSDGDGIGDDVDNCPRDPNPDQADADGDGLGDACDPRVDTDGDGIEDAFDNCPFTPNTDQIDLDIDGIGDACDPFIDSDGDGIPDSADNCPFAPNADQIDSDGDGFGDVCDPGIDTDGDGVDDDQDNCPTTPNTDQLDTDGDGPGDACDPDDDNDTIPDSDDNCPLNANTDQADADSDGIGDACDTVASPIIGDRVWHDLNANGIQDSGEPGLSNVVVNLYTSGGALQTTTSSQADGAYSFKGLPTGSYYLTFVPPSGYSITPQNQGQDDTRDSDASPNNGQTVIFSAPEGTTNLTYDAGMYRLGAVGDFVWADLNANGVQDSGEPGLGGVTVLLATSSEVTVGTTTSGQDGSYLFSELYPGDYFIEFSFAGPTPYIFTFQDRGTDDTLDSDAGITGFTQTFTVLSGRTNRTVDAGMVTAATIGGQFWNDLNTNGIQDTGEPFTNSSASCARADLTQTTDGSLVSSSDIAASTGNYNFAGVLPGQYYIQYTHCETGGTSFSPPNQGADDTTDSDLETGNRTADFFVVQGINDFTWDVGWYLAPEVIAQPGWHDLNVNGALNAGESLAALPGVSAALYTGGGTFVQTLPFGTPVSVSPGTYYVQYMIPAGYMVSPSGSENTVDAAGRTANFTLNAGNSYTSYAALYQNAAAIGGDFWHDLDGDGIQDAGEPVSAELCFDVTLTTASGSPVSTIPVTATYSFTNVPPGEYYLVYTCAIPGGMAFSPANQGGNDALDSDMDGVHTASFMVPSGATDMTWDVGWYESPAVGAMPAWEDFNANGTVDVNESIFPGIPGAAAAIYRSDGTFVRNLTFGYIEYIGVPGTYYVQYTVPAGYVFSPPGPDNDVDATGRTPNFTLLSRQNTSTVAAAYLLQSTVGGQIWEDLNGNDVQNGGEPLSNPFCSAVDLRRTIDSSLVATQPLATSGTYSFSGLVSGQYYLQFMCTFFSGIEVSTPNQGGDDTLDSDLESGDRTADFTLAPGATDMTWDVGWVNVPGVIADVLWEDPNGNGILDGGETLTLMPGAQADLYTSGGSFVVTLNFGMDAYVAPGTYYIQYTAPTGAIFSALGSHNDADASGRTGNFTVLSGQVHTSIAAAHY